MQGVDVSAATGSLERVAFCISTARRAGALIRGFTLAARAATPVTIGAAIEVPLLVSQPPSWEAERICAPGAATCTASRPKLENSLMPRPLSGSVEATASRFAAGTAAG